MSDVFMTIVVPSYSVNKARNILSKYPDGADSFTAECSSTGKSPTTHYLATGLGPEEYIVALKDVSGIDISNESWESALNRLGLQPVLGGDLSSSASTSNLEE